MSYQYPISIDWSTDEIVNVIQFFSSVEKAYEAGVDRNQFAEAYKKFKVVVPSKSEEKKLCGEFEKESGYSSYHAVKKMLEDPSKKIIKM